MKTFRFYHLLFAAGCLIVYFTAEELGLVHAWTGYVIASLVVLRLLLGVARSRGFEFRRLMPFSTPDWQGRLASLSALALIAAVAGTAGTGIAMDQGGTLVGKSIRADDGKHKREHREEEDEALASPSTLFGLVTAARAESEEGEGREEGPLGEVHETLGNLILPLAIFHALMLLVFRLDLARFILFLPRRKA